MGSSDAEPVLHPKASTQFRGCFSLSLFSLTLFNPLSSTKQINHSLKPHPRFLWLPLTSRVESSLSRFSIFASPFLSGFRLFRSTIRLSSSYTKYVIHRRLDRQFPGREFHFTNQEREGQTDFVVFGGT